MEKGPDLSQSQIQLEIAPKNKFPWIWCCSCGCLLFLLCAGIFGFYTYYSATTFNNYVNEGSSVIRDVCNDLGKSASVNSRFVSGANSLDISDAQKSLKNCTKASFSSASYTSGSREELNLKGQVEYNLGDPRALDLTLVKESGSWKIFRIKVQ